MISSGVPRLAFVLLLLVPACRFSLRPIEVHTDDLGATDLAGNDLAGPVDDLSNPGDLTNVTPVDLPMPIDLPILIDLIPPADLRVPPILSGVREDLGSTIELSAGDPIDWTHYGLTSTSDVNRKAGVTPVINMTTMGTVNRADMLVTTTTWTGGMPVATQAGTKTGLYMFGFGNGFTVTLPAGTTPRNARLHVAVNGGTTTLNAHLSDGSIADYTNALTNNVGPSYVRYTINYRASRDGETLTITWKLTADQGIATVALIGVTYF